MGGLRNATSKPKAPHLGTVESGGSCDVGGGSRGSRTITYLFQWQGHDTSFVFRSLSLENTV